MDLQAPMYQSGGVAGVCGQCGAKYRKNGRPLLLMPVMLSRDNHSIDLFASNAVAYSSALAR